MKINALPEQVEIEHNTVLTLFRMEGGGGEQPRGSPAPYQFFPCDFHKRRNYTKKLS